MIGGSQSHLSGCFCIFGPIILEWWRGSGNESVSAALVVSTLIGGGIT